MPAAKTYPNLSRAYELQSTVGLGTCIPLSVALVLDRPGLSLVFATFKPAPPEEWAEPSNSRVPFIHAFTMFGSWVIAPTLAKRPEDLFRTPAEEYFRINGARDFRFMSRGRVKRLAREIDFEAILTGNPAKRSVGQAFLDAAGVKWMDSGDGGVIPANGILAGVKASAL
jgi:hypothetical protein